MCDMQSMMFVTMAVQDVNKLVITIARMNVTDVHATNLCVPVMYVAIWYTTVRNRTIRNRSIMTRDVFRVHSL